MSWIIYTVYVVWYLYFLHGASRIYLNGSSLGANATKTTISFEAQETTAGHVTRLALQSKSIVSYSIGAEVCQVGHFFCIIASCSGETQPSRVWRRSPVTFPSLLGSEKLELKLSEESFRAHSHRLGKCGEKECGARRCGEAKKVKSCS